MCSRIDNYGKNNLTCLISLNISSVPYIFDRNEKNDSEAQVMPTTILKSKWHSVDTSVESISDSIVGGIFLKVLMAVLMPLLCSSGDAIVG